MNTDDRISEINALPRRGFLRFSLGATASLLLPRFLDDQSLQAREQAAGSPALILLWLDGGPSHLDTFDPKPAHPNGGEFKSIATAADGIEICEHLPQLARQMDKIALVRSMTSKEGSHERGRYLVQTGHLPMGGTIHPALGAIVSDELGDDKPSIPSFVSVAVPSTGAGFLGMQHAAFHIPNPEQKPPNASLPAGVSPSRFDRRLNMLKSLEQGFIATRRGEEAIDHFEVYEQGVRLMNARERAAFDVQQEKPTLRDAYGRTPFGQGCLLARRLVEAGVKCVQVSLRGWDTHLRNFETTRNLMETFDPAYASLVQDLNDRGMLDRTLVVCLGEFGRTPKINALGGRDHWPKTWTASLAGGGIRGGQVVGETSRDGSDVAARPVTVPDLCATICKSLRIDANKENVTPAGRPISIVDGRGNAVDELF